MILFLLAFLAGLVVGVLYHRIAKQDWQRELDKADEASGFWQMNSLELVRYNAALEHRIQELERQQPRMAIDERVGFVWVERGT